MFERHLLFYVSINKFIFQFKCITIVIWFFSHNPSGHICDSSILWRLSWDICSDNAVVSNFISRFWCSSLNLGSIWFGTKLFRPPKCSCPHLLCGCCTFSTVHCWLLCPTCKSIIKFKAKNSLETIFFILFLSRV